MPYTDPLNTRGAQALPVDTPTSTIALRQATDRIGSLEQRVNRMLPHQVVPTGSSIFVSGWQDYGDSYAPLRVTRADNLVILEGLVKRVSGSSAVIANLPPGARPSRGHVMFPVASYTGFAAVSIFSTGDVYYWGSDYTYVSLGGIFFTV